jgi:hypothetical protein
MAQVVNCRSFTTEALVRSQINICGIYARQSNVRIGVSASTHSSPVFIIPPMLHAHVLVFAALNRRTNGQSLGTLKSKAVLPFDKKVYFLSLNG